MSSIKNWLNGKRTYIVVVMGLLTSLLAWLDGQIDSKAMIAAILVGAYAIFNRAGTAKVQKTVEALLAAPDDTAKEK
jgi:hypothetical protein